MPKYTDNENLLNLRFAKEVERCTSTPQGRMGTFDPKVIASLPWQNLKLIFCLGNILIYVIVCASMFNYNPSFSYSHAHIVT